MIASWDCRVQIKDDFVILQITYIQLSIFSFKTALIFGDSGLPIFTLYSADDDKSTVSKHLLTNDSLVARSLTFFLVQVLEFVVSCKFSSMPVFLLSGVGSLSFPLTPPRPGASSNRCVGNLYRSLQHCDVQKGIRTLVELYK